MSGLTSEWHRRGMSRDDLRETAMDQPVIRAPSAQTGSDQLLTFALMAGRMVAWEYCPATGLSLRTGDSVGILGLPATGPGQDFLNAVHADDRDMVRSAILSALRGEAQYSVQCRIVLPSGKTNWIEDRAVLLVDERQNPLKLVGVSLDITERRLAEDRNAQLCAELQEADRQKDVFLAMLSHELRNPLAPIKTSLQILTMPSIDLAMVRRTRDIMDRQIDQLVRLVDDLLDVSRVQRGKVELRQERIDLGRVLAHAVEMAQPQISAMRHELIVSIEPTPLELDVDPARMTQVFCNLLNNAAKYMEPGGQIWLTAQRQNARAVVRVTDRGIGIDPQMLPRIFDLFMQADQTATRSQGGLGIGLTLVKRLVELHGGSVEAVSSGLGQGSEFIVRLPLPHSAPQLPEAAPRTRAMPSVRRRMLVVDDNADAAESLALLLRLIGHDVVAVDNGLAAITAAETEEFEVIFLDIAMPAMDGYETAQRLRRVRGAQHARLIAVTGWGQSEHRERSKAAGFHYHLIKPADLRSLQEILSGILP